MVHEKAGEKCSTGFKTKEIREIVGVSLTRFINFPISPTLTLKHPALCHLRAESSFRQAER